MSALELCLDLVYLRPPSFRDCFSVSSHVVRLHSLRMISGRIKRRKFISKNVVLYSRLIPCVKRQSFVAAEQSTRTRNHHRLTGNVRQSSTKIRFHILKISRSIHKIHLFMHLLQLGSELLCCLDTMFHPDFLDIRTCSPELLEWVHTLLGFFPSVLRHVLTGCQGSKLFNL